MATIQLKHLFKDYQKGVHAVADFNMTIHDREFIVLVGPSGCGKSTTLRMIAGLEEVTSGEIWIDDKKVNEVHPKDRDIAMVFQNYALYPHMTVYENLAFGLRMRQSSKEKIDERVKETAEILGLTDLLKRFPKELSGGQRQRVALGRAIAREAKVFLMDEPLSNLDAKLRLQTRAEITKLHHRLKTTTVYVTHDQTEAMTMSSRIVVMDQGYVQQIGSPKEIYLRPANLFVAKFIGSPSMNILKGILRAGAFHIDEEKVQLPETLWNKLVEKGYEGKPIILGIRPEHIHLASEAAESENYIQINSTVDLAEFNGSETLIYFYLGTRQMISKVNSLEDFPMGSDIQLNFDMEKAHFFDTEAETRISLEGETEKVVGNE